MWIPLARSAGACAILLAFSSSICAEAAAPGSAAARFITLEEALASTLERNPQLRAGGYQLDIERGRVQQAGLAPNPELRLSVEDAMGTGAYGGFGSAETTLSLGWLFERGVREHRVAAARASESLSASEIEILRVDLAAETARRFLTLLAHQARAATVDEEVQLAQMTVKAVQRRVAAGRSPEADLARAQAELAVAVLRQENLAHGTRAARQRLAAQWGSMRPDFEEAQGDPYGLPVALPFADLQRQAEQNPQMTRYLTKQRLDEAELRLAEAQRKPGWGGSVGARRYESTDDFALVASFSIPLPIRNRNQGNIAAAHAMVERTAADMAATNVDIAMTLYVFYETMQYSLHRANTLRNDVLPRIEFALAETRAAYEAGRYGYLDLRTVQAELIEAKNALLEASIDAHRNVIEIEHLTGVRFAQQGITP